MLPSILIVDDEEEILAFLERTLRARYTVFKAETGAAALTILESEAIQLVVSDVMMPEMDGFQLCRAIKKNLEFSHIPVILLTAKNSVQAKVEGLELGADAYIEKPFSKEHLLAQIGSLINNRKMLREYFANSPLVHIKSMAYSRTEEQFLEKLQDTIERHLDDPGLDVEQLARVMNITRITLYRKIKAVTNLTPAELITTTRLKKAAALLANGQFKVFEVAAQAGFSSQSNFARSFHKQFGLSPSDFLQMKQAEKNKSID